ncbi:hypothetical protein HYQ46_003011 [Verticillium longisporum]|nr:hypothetical protein HYQ46_003011 [Verticillium longisporum]
MSFWSRRRRHNFGNTLVGVDWEHDVGDNVDIALVDPAKGSVDATVQVVELHAIDTETAKLFPYILVAQALHKVAVVACHGTMHLSRVNSEQGAIIRS